MNRFFISIGKVFKWIFFTIPPLILYLFGFAYTIVAFGFSVIPNNTQYKALIAGIGLNATLSALCYATNGASKNEADQKFFTIQGKNCFLQRYYLFLR